MSDAAKVVAGLPYVILVPLAVLMAVAPFGATPHLVEKWRMLFDGTLRKAIDWFDLVLHTAPLLILAMKIIIDIRKVRS